jgi:hypothetical protein
MCEITPVGVMLCIWNVTVVTITATLMSVAKEAVQLYRNLPKSRPLLGET